MVLSAPKELAAHIWTANASLIIFLIFRKNTDLATPPPPTPAPGAGGVVMKNGKSKKQNFKKIHVFDFSFLSLHHLPGRGGGGGEVGIFFEKKTKIR